MSALSVPVFLLNPPFYLILFIWLKNKLRKYINSAILLNVIV